MLCAGQHSRLLLAREVVSPLEVLEEKAEYFVSVGRMFESLMFGIYGATRPYAPMQQNHFDDMLRQWSELQSKCQEMGMEYTSNSLKQGVEHFHRFRELVMYENVMSRTGEIYRIFTAELGKQKFFCLIPGRAKYYVSLDADPAFGQVVADAFTGAVYDIREASRCLATERDTACVLHLMRVLELGLQRLAGRFSVAFARENWNKIIDQIESGIRNLEKVDPRPADWKEEQERFSRIGKEFRYFKDAWRNHAMHSRARYDFEEAEVIYRHCREFMVELAGALPQEE